MNDLSIYFADDETLIAIGEKPRDRCLKSETEFTDYFQLRCGYSKICSDSFASNPEAITKFRGLLMNFGRIGPARIEEILEQFPSRRM